LGNVQILIDNVTNLFGAEIRLQFDPNIVQIQDSDPDAEGVQIQPGNFPSPDFVQTNRADNETGDILYTLTQLTPTPPASGSGLLATITFEAIAQGNSDLSFTTAKLSDANGQSITVDIQPGQIIVDQGSVQPTATFTPISDQTTPTLTPTVTFTPVQPTATPTASPTSTPAASPTNTPVPPITDIPPGATVGFCYRVQKGDTLYSIAQTFGVDVHSVTAVNDLYPPGYIFVHQALFIPTQSGYGPKVYVVQADDTLSSIADQCHLPVSFLASVNKLGEDATLQPGHVLKIPIPPFPPPSRFPHPPPGPPSIFPPPAPIFPPSPRRCDYIVQPGDTLYSIGRRYGCSPHVLARINGLHNPNYIYVGQCLILPN
jgi:LysM repeat protein